MAKRKRPRPDIQYAEKLGWRFDGHTGSGHYRYRHPSTGLTLIFSKTTSDNRAIRNSISVINKHTPQEHQQ